MSDNIKFCVNCKSLANGTTNVYMRDYKKLCDYNTTLANSSHLSKILDANQQLENIFQEKCFYPLKRKKGTTIEVLDKDNHLAKTRTEQLALPKPRKCCRKLVELQKCEAFTKFNDVRKNQAINLYKKSLLSVYNRFMKEKAKKEKETEQSSKKLNDFTKPYFIEHLRNLAKPKQDFSKLKTKTEDIKTFRTPALQRIKQLSTPKTKRCDPKNKKWILTKALKNYKPTQRLYELAKPKVYETNDYEEAFKVQPKALVYKASPRIKELSKPQKINTRTVENKQDEGFKIRRKALKAKLSERIKELATPKEYINKHIKTKPFSVPKAALNAKASRRIDELAKSKIKQF